MKKLFSYFCELEFLKFLIIGGINTFGGMVYSYIYSLFLQENAAFVVGYVTSLSIAYVLNAIFVFKEKLKASKYVRFCISYVPNFIIQNVIVLIVYNALHWHKLIAFALAAAVGIPVTYLMVKLFAFGHGQSRKSS